MGSLNMPHGMETIIKLSLEGVLTFLSARKLENIENRLLHLQPGQTVLLNLSSITNMDISGASAIIAFYSLCLKRHCEFYIEGLPRQFENLFLNNGGEALIKNRYLLQSHAVQNDSHPIHSAYAKLIQGVKSYHHATKNLAETPKSENWHPHTLFITCADSCLNPSEITATKPGEIFVIRNIGNFIPPYHPSSQFSEVAALEFALTYLDITDVIVCGHANCGAMRACQNYDHEKLSDGLDQWIGLIRSQVSFDDSTSIDELACKNVLNQLVNIQKYPFVQTQLAQNKLTFHAWFYDFKKSTVFEWNAKTNHFQQIGNRTPSIA